MSQHHTPNAHDRRGAPRHPAARLPSLRASILAGPDVTVINVSRGGLLVQSDVRLKPGLGICLSLTLDGVIHVLDGKVSHATARFEDQRVVYCVGIALDQETTIFDSVAAGAAPAAPASTSRADVAEPVITERDYELELAVLREQLERERREREQEARTLETVRGALESGERLRRELADAHAADRSQWESEQRELVVRTREAEEQAASMAHDMRVARDEARRVARQHAQERAEAEARVREREQQLTELRASQAALLESLTQRLKNYEHRDDATRQQHDRVNAQLTAAEAWGAGQQDLLYRIRQQINVIFALIQGTDAARQAPAALPDDRPEPPMGAHALPTPARAGQPAAADRKVTHVRDLTLLISQGPDRSAAAARALAPAIEKTGT
jgi:hypothetical protein